VDADVRNRIGRLYLVARPASADASAGDWRRLGRTLPVRFSCRRLNQKATPLRRKFSRAILQGRAGGRQIVPITRTTIIGAEQARRRSAAGAAIAPKCRRDADRIPSHESRPWRAGTALTKTSALSLGMDGHGRIGRGMTFAGNLAEPERSTRPQTTGKRPALELSSGPHIGDECGPPPRSGGTLISQGATKEEAAQCPLAGGATAIHIGRGLINDVGDHRRSATAAQPKCRDEGLSTLVSSLMLRAPRSFARGHAQGVQPPPSLSLRLGSSSGWHDAGEDDAAGFTGRPGRAEGFMPNSRWRRQDRGRPGGRSPGGALSAGNRRLIPQMILPDRGTPGKSPPSRHLALELGEQNPDRCTRGSRSCHRQFTGFPFRHSAAAPRGTEAGIGS